MLRIKLEMIKHIWHKLVGYFGGLETCKSDSI